MNGSAESVRSASVGQYLDQLASAAPTPGGGSVAAISGATAAALLSMVSVISGPKAGGEQAERYAAADAAAQQARRTLEQLADDDIAVFGLLAGAYKLPRSTDEEKAARKAELQRTGRAACDVPLAVIAASAGLLPWCRELAESSPKLLVSDIGVAVSLVRSAVESAALNVAINLAGLNDQDYCAAARAATAEALQAAEATARQVLARVNERIAA
jgi:formiminotetrahydrofolate cyclodeaminase